MMDNKNQCSGKTGNEYLQSALELHRYTTHKHWDGQRLSGPDPGLRFDFRIFRFIKSYLPLLPWNDQYYFLQCQSYWIKNNWWLFKLTNDPKYTEIKPQTRVRT